MSTPYDIPSTLPFGIETCPVGVAAGVESEGYKASGAETIGSGKSGAMTRTGQLQPGGKSLFGPSQNNTGVVPKISPSGVTVPSLPKDTNKPQETPAGRTPMNVNVSFNIQSDSPAEIAKVASSKLQDVLIKMQKQSAIGNT